MLAGFRRVHLGLGLLAANRLHQLTLACYDVTDFGYSGCHSWTKAFRRSGFLQGSVRQLGHHFGVDFVEHLPNLASLLGHRRAPAAPVFVQYCLPRCLCSEHEAARCL